MSETKTANLSIYRITNRLNGDRRWAVTVFPQEACSSLGWPFEDCDIFRLTAIRHTRPDGVKGVMVQVPCQVCPYQYAECQKEPEKPCPARYNIPDLAKWLAASCNAHLCAFVGQPLFKKDYEVSLMWLTLPTAIDYVNLQPH